MNEDFRWSKLYQCSRPLARSCDFLAEGPLLALVTDHVLDNNARSFVVLNSTFPRRPSVLFAEGWRDEKYCLQYANTPQFELETDKETIDIHGHEWWHEFGVIVSINSDLYIRAAPFDAFAGRSQLVSIKSGSLFTGQIPNSAWTFSVWRLSIRGATVEQKVPLYEFDIRSQAQAE